MNESIKIALAVSLAIISGLTIGISAAEIKPMMSELGFSAALTSVFALALLANYAINR